LNLQPVGFIKLPLNFLYTIAHQNFKRFEEKKESVRLFTYFLFLTINFYRLPLKTSAWRLIIPAILGGLIVSLIIETLQVYFPTRNSSLSDLI
jgi:VanZ family protein